MTVPIQYLLEGADEVNEAVRMLLAENEKLKAELKRKDKGIENMADIIKSAYKQRDAAVADLNQYGQCGACKRHYQTDGSCGADDHSWCDGGFLWRGLVKEDAQ